HARMGRLVQPPPAAGTHRKHSPGRSRRPLLRYARTASHGSVTQTKSPPEHPGRFTIATKLGLTNHTFPASSRDELEPAFDAMVKAGMQAVTINSEGLAYQQMEFIAKLAIARRLPLSVWSRETLEAGALMSYGADQVAMCRRAAVFVDKILKGAKPADLPVEEPTKIEFLLNKNTAKALGLTLPNTL